MVSFNFLLGPSCQDLYIIADAVVCSGDSFLYNGLWLTEGNHSFILNAPGAACDTLVEVAVGSLPPILYDALSSWSCDSLGVIDLQISGTDPFTIDWMPSGGDTTILEGIVAGTYFFHITDGNGCVVYDSIEVVESALLNFQLEPWHVVDPGDSVLVEITGDIHNPGLSFSWSLHSILSCDTCPSTLVAPVSDTLLSVTIVDVAGCVYELETTILLADDSTTADRIYVPNVFTPDGDGVNDHWRIFSRMDNTFVHTLTLYDRWGHVLFSKNDFILDSFIGWDGTFKHKPLNPGVFVFTAELILGDGRPMHVKGDVTLVR
jgi:gliding motility-associated-like protein